MTERQVGVRRRGFDQRHDPAVGAEADGVAQREVEARVPVDDDKQVDEHLGDAERVGPAGARLRLVEEGQEARQAQQSVGAHHHGARRAVAAQDALQSTP